METYLCPKDAAGVMGISVSTITRCVKRGAPIHRWGSTGYRYRICVREFIAWMESQGAANETRSNMICMDEAAELAAKRRAMVAAI